MSGKEEKQEAPFDVPVEESGELSDAEGVPEPAEPIPEAGPAVLNWTYRKEKAFLTGVQTAGPADLYVTTASTAKAAPATSVVNNECLANLASAGELELCNSLRGLTLHGSFSGVTFLKFLAACKTCVRGGPPSVVLWAGDARNPLHDIGKLDAQPALNEKERFNGIFTIGPYWREGSIVRLFERLARDNLVHTLALASVFTQCLPASRELWLSKETGRSFLRPVKLVLGARLQLDEVHTRVPVDGLRLETLFVNVSSVLGRRDDYDSLLKRESARLMHDLRHEFGYTGVGFRLTQIGWRQDVTGFEMREFVQFLKPFVAKLNEVELILHNIGNPAMDLPKFEARARNAKWLHTLFSGTVVLRKGDKPWVFRLAHAFTLEELLDYVAYEYGVLDLPAEGGSEPLDEYCARIDQQVNEWRRLKNEPKHHTTVTAIHVSSMSIMGDDKPGDREKMIRVVKKHFQKCEVTAEVAREMHTKMSSRIDHKWGNETSALCDQHMIQTLVAASTALASASLARTKNPPRYYPEYDLGELLLTKVGATPPTIKQFGDRYTAVSTGPADGTLPGPPRLDDSAKELNAVYTSRARIVQAHIYGHITLKMSLVLTAMIRNADLRHLTLCGVPAAEEDVYIWPRQLDKLYEEGIGGIKQLSIGDRPTLDGLLTWNADGQPVGLFAAMSKNSDRSRTIPLQCVFFGDAKEEAKKVDDDVLDEFWASFWRSVYPSLTYASVTVAFGCDWQWGAVSAPNLQTLRLSYTKYSLPMTETFGSSITDMEIHFGSHSSAGDIEKTAATLRQQHATEDVTYPGGLMPYPDGLRRLGFVCSDEYHHYAGIILDWVRRAWPTLVPSTHRLLDLRSDSNALKTIAAMEAVVVAEGKKEEKKEDEEEEEEEEEDVSSKFPACGVTAIVLGKVLALWTKNKKTVDTRVKIVAESVLRMRCFDNVRTLYIPEAILRGTPEMSFSLRDETKFRSIKVLFEEPGLGEFEAIPVHSEYHYLASAVLNADAAPVREELKRATAATAIQKKAKARRAAITLAKQDVLQDPETRKPLTAEQAARQVERERKSSWELGDAASSDPEGQKQARAERIKRLMDQVAEVLDEEDVSEEKKDFSWFKQPGDWGLDQRESLRLLFKRIYDLANEVYFDKWYSRKIGASKLKDCKTDSTIRAETVWNFDFDVAGLVTWSQYDSKRHRSRAFVSVATLNEVRRHWRAAEAAAAKDVIFMGVVVKSIEELVVQIVLRHMTLVLMRAKNPYTKRIGGVLVGEGSPDSPLTDDLFTNPHEVRMSTLYVNQTGVFPFIWYGGDVAAYRTRTNELIQLTSGFSKKATRSKNAPFGIMWDPVTKTNIPGTTMPLMGSGTHKFKPFVIEWDSGTLTQQPGIDGKERLEYGYFLGAKDLAAAKTYGLFIVRPLMSLPARTYCIWHHVDLWRIKRFAILDDAAMVSDIKAAARTLSQRYKSTGEQKKEKMEPLPDGFIDPNFKARYRELVKRSTGPRSGMDDGEASEGEASGTEAEADEASGAEEEAEPPMNAEQEPESPISRRTRQHNNKKKKPPPPPPAKEEEKKKERPRFEKDFLEQPHNFPPPPDDDKRVYVFTDRDSNQGGGFSFMHRQRGGELFSFPSGGKQHKYPTMLHYAYGQLFAASADGTPITAPGGSREKWSAHGILEDLSSRLKLITPDIRSDELARAMELALIMHLSRNKRARADFLASRLDQPKITSIEWHGLDTNTSKKETWKIRNDIGGHEVWTWVFEVLASVSTKMEAMYSSAGRPLPPARLTVGCVPVVGDYYDHKAPAIVASQWSRNDCGPATGFQILRGHIERHEATLRAEAKAGRCLASLLRVYDVHQQSALSHHKPLPSVVLGKRKEYWHWFQLVLYDHLARGWSPGMEWPALTPDWKNMDMGNVYGSMLHESPADGAKTRGPLMENYSLTASTYNRTTQAPYSDVPTWKIPAHSADEVGVDLDLVTMQDNVDRATCSSPLTWIIFPAELVEARGVRRAPRLVFVEEPVPTVRGVTPFYSRIQRTISLAVVDQKERVFYDLCGVVYGHGGAGAHFYADVRYGNNPNFYHYDTCAHGQAEATMNDGGMLRTEVGSAGRDADEWLKQFRMAVFERRAKESPWPGLTKSEAEYEPVRQEAVRKSFETVWPTKQLERKERLEKERRDSKQAAKKAQEKEARKMKKQKKKEKDVEVVNVESSKEEDGGVMDLDSDSDDEPLSVVLGRQDKWEKFKEEHSAARARVNEKDKFIVAESTLRRDDGSKILDADGKPMQGLFVAPPDPGGKEESFQGFRRGERIMIYSGEAIKEAEFNRRYPDRKKNKPRHTVELRGGKFIDASDPEKSGLARYANNGGRENNARINQHGALDATKKIRRGDEILWAYGNGHYIHKEAPSMEVEDDAEATQSEDE